MTCKENCKDCIHYECCCGWSSVDVVNSLIGVDFVEPCKDFKPKSRFVELPCEVGQKVWFIQDEKIYEGTVILIRPFIHKDRTTFHGNVEYELEDPFYHDGRMMKHQISVVFQEFGNNTIAYFTSEDAEKALKEKGR